MTVFQIHGFLHDRDCSLSLSTILHSRLSLGWTFHSSAYCQMIREVNRAKQVEWARQYQHEAKNGFRDVGFTDETSVQLETHRRFCCRKRGEPPRNKHRYAYN